MVRDCRLARDYETGHDDRTSWQRVPNTIVASFIRLNLVDLSTLRCRLPIL